VTRQKNILEASRPWKDVQEKRRTGLQTVKILYITLPPSIIPQVYKTKEHSRSFQIIVPREVL
jgi:hypothetical protein